MSVAHTHSDTPNVFPGQGMSAVSTTARLINPFLLHLKSMYAAGHDNTH